MHSTVKTNHVYSHIQYLVIGCAVLINLQLGLNYSWSVFSKVLIQEHGWSYTQAALPNTATSLSYSLSMLAFGLIQEKYGPRLSLAVGSILMGAGLILSSFWLTVSGVVIGYGILFGCGVGACFSTTQATVLKWISADRQGLAAGITSGTYGISSILIAATAEYLLSRVGISATFFTMAVTSTPIILFLCRFIRLPDIQNTKIQNVMANETSPCTDKTCLEMIKTRTFFCLLGVYILSTATSMMPLSHISMIATLQTNVENSTIFVGILTLSNCLARFIGGYLGDRFSEKLVFLISGLVNFFNILFFSHYTTFTSLALGCIINGWHCGVLMALMPSLVSKLFGQRYCAQNFGVLAGFGLVSGLIGSQAAGLLVDTFGSYAHAYWLCALYLAVATILSAILPNHNKVL